MEVARWVRMAMDTMEDWSRWMMKRGEMDHGGKLGMERGGRIEVPEEGEGREGVVVWDGVLGLSIILRILQGLESS